MLGRMVRTVAESRSIGATIFQTTETDE